ncbi:MAG: hypothetical protein V4633_18395 [Pseudomonadota bacterium]
MGQRSLSIVPRAIPALLVLALALQVAWQRWSPPPPAATVLLEAPPALALLRLSALGEPIALSRVLMFHVQGADQGRGYGKLDYDNLEQWLTRISDLDPRAQYPLRAASHVYAAVGDPAKKRQMLEFIHQRFWLDPEHRWPSMAYAAIAAKHELHDLPLARRYASAIRRQASGPGVPDWARQMEIFILEDMNQIESAKILLGGLIASGQVSDPQERRFLLERLRQMEKR